MVGVTLCIPELEMTAHAQQHHIAHETGPSSVAAKTRAKAQRDQERKPAPQREPEPDPTADAAPEDLVLKEPKQKRPRNKRHGRPR